MNQVLLDVVCCPCCRSDLTIADGAAKQGLLDDGALACSSCHRRFRVKAGIPILLGEDGAPGQEPERNFRKGIADRYQNADSKALFRGLGREHYLPAMKKAAECFARQLNADAWLLDLGLGWGWHWVGVDHPNIVGLDFSFDQLLIAKRLLASQVDRNVHLVCADGASLPLKDRTVDGTWTVQALQYLPPASLETCLSRLSTVQKEEAAVAVYWVNWNRPHTMARKLLGREALKERVEPFYLRAVTGEELRELLARCTDGNIEIGYNETFFHPDLRFRHQLPLAWLDTALGSVPLLNRFMAHQVVARIRPHGRKNGAGLIR